MECFTRELCLTSWRQIKNNDRIAISQKKHL